MSNRFFQSVASALFVSTCSFALFFFISACQITPVGPRSAVAQANSSSEESNGQRVRDELPPDQRVKSRDLYAALSHAKALESRAGDTKTLTAFDVVCEIDSRKNKLLCHASTLPEGQKGGRRVEFSEKDSTEVFGQLSRLPIRKGDSGLAADYVICRYTQMPAVPGIAAEEYYDCAVAMPIQFVPHSTMPSTSEGED